MTTSTTSTSAMVLGTSARPVHPGCTTPSQPHTSWHRDSHRVLVESTCPDCSARWAVEVDRDRPPAPVFDESLDGIEALTTWQDLAVEDIPARTAKAAAVKALAGGWEVRVQTARGIEKGEHDVEAVVMRASRDDPRAVVQMQWRRRDAVKDPGWKGYRAWLLHPVPVNLGIRAATAALDAAKVDQALVDARAALDAQVAGAADAERRATRLGFLVTAFAASPDIVLTTDQIRDRLPEPMSTDDAQAFVESLLVGSGDEPPVLRPGVRTDHHLVKDGYRLVDNDGRPGDGPDGFKVEVGPDGTERPMTRVRWKVGHSWRVRGYRLTEDVSDKASGRGSAKQRSAASGG